MNLCNFAKVIQARSTKEPSTIQSWQTSSNNETFSSPQNASNIGVSQRYAFYMKFMQRFPKLHVTQNNFGNNIRKVQDYVHKTKYFNGNNKNGERSRFVEHFSLQSWEKLPYSEKITHTYTNCNPCQLLHSEYSSLHKSYSSSNIPSACKSLGESISALQTNRSMSQKTGLQVIKSIVNVIQPVVEKNLNIQFPKDVSSCISPSFTTMRDTTTVMKNVSSSISASLVADDTDVSHFLALNKSYSQHDKERIAMGFISTQEAESEKISRLEKEAKQKVQKKVHHGKFESYIFEKDAVLQEVRNYPAGRPVNWTRLARNYNVTINGKTPDNAGQVLKAFCKSQGVKTEQFNIAKVESCRDIQRRTRRRKKRIGKTRLSVPVQRSAKKIKNAIKTMCQNKQIDLGKKVVHKSLKENKINKNGMIEETECKLYSRKIPLTAIIDSEIKRFNDAGVLRIDGKVRKHHLKVWHDHSEILNHSYFNCMVMFLYNTEIFLSDQEYGTKFPNKKGLDVQSFVERPQLHIFGQSGSSDVEQLEYSQTRLKDLASLSELQNPPILRVFSGDNPARQFESGQQRGGSYSCICGINVEDHTNLECAFRTLPSSLEERRQVVVAGSLWRQLQNGKINPFQNLKKQEIVDELEARGIWDYGNLKPELSAQMSNLLHGINRPPALMVPNPEKSAASLGIGMYDVLGCEPLHDICNIVQNIITELPFHVPEQSRKDFESFSSTTIGDKTQLKGSDARLFAVKLASFMQSMHHDGKV
ncbi:hypothetical protein FSP39_010990 [Pinctada imbricata]|uniref:Uncharacterized protein n=1 Tax=Pinctada imbricata TaxID=66713 RepID=A0AA88YTD5_PINIB|nr:hypothetical protein FSP39_010990 [Pinctada imbricata]